MRPSTLLFGALLAVSAVFTWRTSGALPQMVASHFLSSGQANGFMPRAVYRWVALAVVLLPPTLVACLPTALLRRGDHRINLPHGDYWLAPERRTDTLDFLRRHGLWFAAGLAVFLAFLQEQVVQANLRHPPVLNTDAMRAALIGLLVGIAVWLYALHARFRRPH